MKSAFLILTAILIFGHACAAYMDGISASVRARIELVRLDDKTQQQVDKIDALTLTDLPPQGQNTSYLTQQAKAMYEKARKCYQRGINLYSINIDTSGPLPPNGQSGAQYPGHNKGDEGAGSMHHLCCDKNSSGP